MTLLALLAWVVLNLSLVVAAWMRSYYAPIEPVPRAAALDLRTDKSTPGRVITIYKKGDDLRQDQFVLQMISLMDR